ncbi:MAG: hypothetical protein F2942_08230 [Actinobacteria bacterium]|uniref:Unannotated protein n=1 Tax=freshwater metagenome TaxID=449393 RepID=A0A6J7UTW5_9ZZZZ|nr:hypothetical protein [Actinomycetota bacterium]
MNDEQSESEQVDPGGTEAEAGTAEAGEPQKHRSKSRVVMVVAGVVAAALVIGAVGFVVSTRDEPEVANAGTGTDILVFLGESVAGAAVGDGFESALGALFPEAPDPTEAKVDEVKAQIDGLTIQISALQAATQGLSDQVDKNFWSENATRLQDDLAALKNMQTSWIAPLAAEGAIYSKARIAGDTAAMATAETNLNKARDNFMNGYNNALVTNEGIADRLHNDIVPSAGATSILSARGKVLMAKGYVTAEDSQELRDLYDTIAQQQALAVYINAEFEALQENGDGLYQQNANDIVTRWRTNQAAELAALPPVIPKAVIIATPNRATANATMWMGSADSAQIPPCGLSVCPFVANPLAQVDALRTAVNARGDNDGYTPFSSYGLQLTGWDYPSTQVQLDQLTAAVASSPGTTVGEKLAAAGKGRTRDLGYVNPGVPSMERVWVNPPATSPQVLTCVNDPDWTVFGISVSEDFTFAIPNMANLNAPTAFIAGLPIAIASPTVTPGSASRPVDAICDSAVQQVWLAGNTLPSGRSSGQSDSAVLWARTVGTGVEEDYMAQSGNYNYNLPASTYPQSSVAKTFANDQTVYPSGGPNGYTCTNPPSQKFVDTNC